jgi:hypothetical protein
MHANRRDVLERLAGGAALPGGLPLANATDVRHFARAASADASDSAHS